MVRESKEKSKTQMLINYVTGEECRIAIVENGKLEEFTSEKFAAQSRVGNIYVGKVINVEPAIQAAFVDFGVGDNGFLHVSDLHPRYFPGESDDATEQVGHKTPRRERPPIQAALRRGDEVFVQVLKEGVGTKGPTLTSYLSIPGRFLVMMPQMDKVGVSRKVEDEEQRRKMREILDQLDLPEGFGFILRTAGLERTKMELKRDLAYLVRLYKDMERRRAQGDKPRLLYAESDLLVRALRDQLTTDVDEIVIDNEQALQRASRFLKIVAPRTSTKLLHYPGRTPIYHAFAVEEQIAHIHAREVPLPSGGRLVIDQTEALVAIDVNSGKSRDSRDAEENAYQTNLEAVDEICRQLRLRDQGGIVVNDLIDMRSMAHRKDVESRLRERLKRDRARTTITTISQFGILEMTRQRMRASSESLHFADCPTCRGRGLVQKPESVTGDALRELAALLDVDKVGRVELVVSPRVAGELLSAKRHLLSRIERTSGKRVDVRVSEAVPVDRVTFYAYDTLGADIDLTQPLPRKRPAELIVVEEPAEASEEDGFTSDSATERDEAHEADVAAGDPSEEVVELGDEPVLLSDEDLDRQIRSDAQEAAASTAEAESQGGGRRRRGGRGRRGGRDDGRAPQGRSDSGRGDQGRAGQGGGQGRGDRGRGGPPRDQNRQDQPPRQQQRPLPEPFRAPDVRRVETERGVILMGDHGDEDGTMPPPLPVQGAAAPQGDQGDDNQEQFDQQGSDGSPDSQGHPQDGQQGDGQGGRRRRRRRGRRGGRGRDGAPGTQQQGQSGQQQNGQPHEGGAAQPVNEFRQPAREGADSEAGDQTSTGDHGDSNQSDGHGQPGAEGEQRGGRRRRRGRRGRGGRGGQGGGPDGGQSGGAPNAGAPANAGGGGQQPIRGNRDYSGYAPGGNSGNSGGNQRHQPRESAAPAQPAPTGPKPKLLYSSRRKLTPAELNKRPKPE
ncbi:MAG: Rne/Rng family ribonuclease [Phycisphaerales bacterium]|nr:Rne/Rng family ribonuclease [Phycisphaerales bacterium]